MGIVFTWFIFALLVGAIGNNKNIGFWGAFVLSLLLSPLIGLIIILCSSSKPPAFLGQPQIPHITPGYQQQAVPNIPINPGAAKAEHNTTDEIAKWKALLDSGAITQEEYDIQKAKLLK